MEIRPIKKEEMLESLKLHQRLYKQKRTVKEWEWEHIKNSNEGSVFGVIVNDNKIVGIQTMIPILLKCKECNIVKSGKSESSLLDPQYRGKGLFEKLYEYTIEESIKRGIKIMWGFTSAAKVWTKLKFQLSQCMKKYVKVVDLKTALIYIFSLREKRYIFMLYKLIFVTTQYTFSRFVDIFLKDNKTTNIRILGNLKNENDILDFQKRFLEEHPDIIIIDFNKEYINWRLKKNPYLNYKIYYAYIGGVLTGYIFMSYKDSNRFYIADIAFLDTNSGIELLNKVTDVARKEKAGFLIFIGNSLNEFINSVEKLLKKNLFFTQTLDVSFVLRINSSLNKTKFAVRNWGLTGLWTEGIDI